MLHLVPSAAKPLKPIKGNKVAGEQQEGILAMQIKTSH